MTNGAMVSRPQATAPTIQSEGAIERWRNREINCRHGSPAGFEGTSNQLVDDIFEKFLAPASVLDGIGVIQGVFFKGCEVLLARLDGSADSGIPGSITALEQLGQAAIGADCRGDLQAAGEGGHSSDVRIEKIDRLKAFTPYLCVEVESPGRQAAHFQDR